MVERLRESCSRREVCVETSLVRAVVRMWSWERERVATEKD